MTKKDLKTGMFGLMSNGNMFVIVGDLIVYQNGGYDEIECMKENLSFSFYRVTYLTTARSFAQLEMKIKEEKDNMLYGKSNETVMTIAEIEQKLGIKNLRIKGEKND